jgi:predicted dehydrogenase
MQDLERLIVYEWGIHLIDLVRFFLGEVNSVYARTNKISSLYGGEERAVVVLATQDITSLIDISWATVGSPDESEGLFKYLETFVIEGDEGTISIFPDHGATLRVATKSGIKEQPVFDGPLAAAYQGSYVAAHSHFIECLREGKKPETEASDNIKTLAATLAAYAAAAGNRSISLR